MEIPEFPSQNFSKAILNIINHKINYFLRTDVKKQNQMPMVALVVETGIETPAC